MRPPIDLARGAEHNPLARELVADIGRALDESPRKRAEFDEIEASVAMIAADLGLSVTLRFDRGRLIVHDGVVGRPDVTIRGDEAALRSLRKLSMPGQGRSLLSPRSGAEARRSLGALAQALTSGRVTIYGLWLHGATVLRLLRVLSEAD